MKKTTWTLLLVMLLGTGSNAFAQSKTGTTVGQFLLIEPSARIAGMGNAGVSSFSEVSASFYNPAALGHLKKSDAQFSYGQWLADITYNYAAAGLRLGTTGTLLLSVTSLNSGDMEVRTVEQPLGTGELFSVKDLSIGVGFSRRMTDRFSAGVQVNYIQETVWHSTLNALGLNFGVLYQLPFRAYLGASISNFGTRGSFDGRDLRIRYDQNPDANGDNSSLPAALFTESFQLPIFFRVGIGYPVTIGERSRATFVFDAFQPSDNTNSVSFGGEWTFMETLSLRGGYQSLFQEDSETGLTLGAGVQAGLAGYELRVDYAWNEYGRIGDVQRFTLGVSF